MSSEQRVIQSATELRLVADAQHLENRIGRLPFERNGPEAAFDEGILDHVGGRPGALDPAFSRPQSAHIVGQLALREEPQLLASSVACRSGNGYRLPPTSKTTRS